MEQLLKAVRLLDEMEEIEQIVKKEGVNVLGKRCVRADLLNILVHNNPGQRTVITQIPQNPTSWYALMKDFRKNPKQRIQQLGLSMKDAEQLVKWNKQCTLLREKANVLTLGLGVDVFSPERIKMLESDAQGRLRVGKRFLGKGAAKLSDKLVDGIKQSIQDVESAIDCFKKHGGQPDIEPKNPFAGW